MSGKPTLPMTTKALRMLLHGRVAIRGNGDECMARVQGDTAEYTVQYGRNGWQCECAYWQHRPSRDCSHICAVKLVWRAIRRGGEIADGDREDAQPVAEAR